MNKPQIIAFYLPQFHPTPENDEWWGKGFTEWTNVAKAKPLFKGHNQPRIPADLGFYDLRVPEVREEQVNLAKEAGVTAFCYWHYWFGNKKRLLERVFDEVLESGKPNFPFCLGWANHSWYAKTWNKDSKQKDKLLIEQTYPGEEDAKEHFTFLLKAFKDNRYIKIDGKPFLFVFEPNDLPAEYINNFEKWSKEAGFNGIYLVANIKPYENKEIYLSKGYSSVLINRTIHYSKTYIKRFEFIKKTKKRLNQYYIVNKSLELTKIIISSIKKNKPTIIDYKKYYPQLITNEELNEDTIPQLMPQWDHTPRSGKYGLTWINATPSNFYYHALDALNAIKNKKNPIIILKSWNEWGEGNYMEPDTIYKDGFIKSLKKAINNTFNH